MHKENDSVQNLHIAKSNKNRILGAMAQHPNEKAVEKLTATPYAMQYAKKYKSNKPVTEQKK